MTTITAERDLADRELAHVRELLTQRVDDLEARFAEQRLADRESLTAAALTADHLRQGLSVQVESLRTTSATHITRDEFQAAHILLGDRLTTLMAAQAEQLRSLELRVTGRLESMTGASAGLRSGWLLLVGAISAVGTAIGVLQFVLNR